MNEFNSEWWSVRLPDDWQTEQDDTCASIFSESGVGALQVSAARNSNGPATDDDLRDFAKEHLDSGAPIKPVTCGAFTGFYLHFSMDDIYQRQWWLRSDDTVVLATYTSDLKDKGKEDTVVDGVLNTLTRN
jgi:hypothetical protein